MFPTIRALIAADATANGLLSGRVYRHGSAPQNTARPYVTWSVPGGVPENTFDGPTHDNFRVQVDCWHDSDSGIETVAEAVRNALETSAYCVGYLANEEDPQTGRYRISFAFDFIESR